ncbi:MAG: HD domain-containing protein [Armatimonadota bacterium]
MNRLEYLRATIDNIVRAQPDLEESRCGFVHLYGVATVCAMLALKRGIDPEICTAAGMLHDIWAYKTGKPADHAHLGATEAEHLLRESGDFTEKEISVICDAIACHSNKGKIDTDICELLKDADVLQHHLYNTSLEVNNSHLERLNAIFAELGIKNGLQPPENLP